MPKQTTKRTKLQVAKEYVSAQLATMKQYGSAPKLSKSAFNDLVRQVAQTTSK